jgi:hypothetical protein
MKKKSIVILSIILTALLCFTSCKNAQQLDNAGNVETNKEQNSDNNTSDKNEEKSTSDKSTEEESKDKDTPTSSTDDSNKPSDSTITTQPSDSEQKPTSIIVSSDSYAYISPEDLQERSDLIFVGKFTGQTNQLMPDTTFQQEHYGFVGTTYVHTDYIFEAVNIIKGENTESIRIRIEGGTDGNTVHISSDIPKFEEGKEYLIYASTGNPLVADDVEHYHIISTHCFKIDNSGNADFSSVQPNDAPKFEAQYKAAKNAAATE